MSENLTVGGGGSSYRGAASSLDVAEVKGSRGNIEAIVNNACLAGIGSGIESGRDFGVSELAVVRSRQGTVLYLRSVSLQMPGPVVRLLWPGGMHRQGNSIGSTLVTRLDLPYSSGHA